MHKGKHVFVYLRVPSYGCDVRYDDDDDDGEEAPRLAAERPLSFGVSFSFGGSFVLRRSR